MNGQFAAAVLALPPAAAAVAWLLQRYEDYFEEKRLFFALAVGLFAGVVTSALEGFLGFERPDFVGIAGTLNAAIYATLGYSVLQAAAQSAVLGAKRFRTRKDTPFYGAGLGLAFGAMMSLWWISYQFHFFGVAAWPVDADGIALWLLLAVGGAGIVLSHGVGCTLIGKASGEGRLLRGILIGALAELPAAALLFAWSPGQESSLLLPRAAIAGLLGAYGLIGILVVRARVLERIVPPEIRDLVRREKRRELRKQE